MNKNQPDNCGQCNLDISKNISFKRTKASNWEPWFYLPPSDKTLEILKKEVAGNHGKNTAFYGEPVAGFKFLDGREVIL